MKRILPVIVISQFFCTSLWFAGNAVVGNIAKQFHLEPAYLAYLTSAVQSGFIAGTLVFAVLSIADRFSPSLVFFGCAILAAVINGLRTDTNMQYIYMLLAVGPVLGLAALLKKDNQAVKA